MMENVYRVYMCARRHCVCGGQVEVQHVSRHSHLDLVQVLDLHMPTAEERYGMRIHDASSERP